MVPSMLPHSLLLLLLHLFAVSAVSANAARSSDGHDKGKGGQRPPYKDPNLSVDERVADLLARMTIEDKMAQLMQGMHTPTCLDG